MRTFKKNLLFSLLATLPLWSFCQPVFPTNSANLSATVADIQQLYGSQINLSTNAIETFIFPFVQGTLSPSMCPPPEPQIQQLGGGSVTIDWAPISTATSYGVYYLNLNTGANGSITTGNTSFSLNGVNGLFLIGIYSNCGEMGRGPSNIIIVDVDVLYPEGDGLQSCACDAIFREDELYNGDPELAPTSYTHYWTDTADGWGPKACENRKYTFSVEGSDEFGPYTSELVFTRQTFLNSIVLHPHCDNNATSSAEEEYHVGSHSELASEYYNLQFNTSHLLITVHPGTNLSLSNMKMDVCACSDGNPMWGRRAADAFSDQFTAFPNPSKDQTQLKYELAEDAEVEILVYDVLGRLVETVLPNSIQNKGAHQITLDMSQWPKGWYACQLASTHFHKTLSLQKE